ncbi:hypothetical protein COK15_15130 [Bacillus cereus]|uniref:hypothetical protein n=1 Tax=Bacillus cereus TaxID=1396 RepID=UPI000BF8CCD6|nr:hypothetical protein [Bacillus cereus]PFQ75689.1 hypothetical protein COK15_15130 [Bacillus cereus]
MNPNLFKNLNLKQELHHKYLGLRDTPSLINEKDQLEKWFEGFEDRDNKIVTEFQTTFHSTLWEIYLYAAFKDMDYEIDFSHDRPDFILKDKPNIMVEATVSNIKQGGIQENTRDLSNILNMFTHPLLQPNFDYELKEAITRYGSSILSKKNKYQHYLKCDWVTPENPYVIALSSYAQVDYGRDYIYGIMALLYGMYFIPEDNDFTLKRSIIKNESAAEIPLGIFFDKSYTDVSAVIFSTTTTIGKLTATVASNNPAYNKNSVFNLYRDFLDENEPYKVSLVTPETKETLTDGLFVFHNPNAKNPLSLEAFQGLGVTQYYFENVALKRTGNPNPTIARISIPKQFINLAGRHIEDSLFTYNSIPKCFLNKFV